MPNRVDGQSTFGSERTPSARVQVTTSLGTASALVLKDTAGVEWAIWVDTTGDLRIGTIANLEGTPNASGTVVGDQTAV